MICQAGIFDNKQALCAVNMKLERILQRRDGSTRCDGLFLARMIKGIGITQRMGDTCMGRNTVRDRMMKRFEEENEKHPAIAGYGM